MKKTVATMVCMLLAIMLIAQSKTVNKVDVKIQDLPKCITEWVTQNMEGYTIDKAYKLETKTPDGLVVTYYVRTVKGKTIQWLQSDASCKEVKKVSTVDAEKASAITKPPKQ